MLWRDIEQISLWLIHPPTLPSLKSQMVKPKFLSLFAFYRHHPLRRKLVCEKGCQDACSRYVVLSLTLIPRCYQNRQSTVGILKSCVHTFPVVLVERLYLNPKIWCRKLSNLFHFPTLYFFEKSPCLS